MAAGDDELERIAWAVVALVGSVLAGIGFLWLISKM